MTKLSYLTILALAFIPFFAQASDMKSSLGLELQNEIKTLNANAWETRLSKRKLENAKGKGSPFKIMATGLNEGVPSCLENWHESVMIIRKDHDSLYRAVLSGLLLNAHEFSEKQMADISKTISELFPKVQCYDVEGHTVKENGLAGRALLALSHTIEQARTLTREAVMKLLMDEELTRSFIYALRCANFNRPGINDRPRMNQPIQAREIGTLAKMFNIPVAIIDAKAKTVQLFDGPKEPCIKSVDEYKPASGMISLHTFPTSNLDDFDLLIGPAPRAMPNPEPATVATKVQPVDINEPFGGAPTKEAKDSEDDWGEVTHVNMEDTAKPDFASSKSVFKADTEDEPQWFLGEWDVPSTLEPKGSSGLVDKEQETPASTVSFADLVAPDLASVIESAMTTCKHAAKNTVAAASKEATTILDVDQALPESIQPCLAEFGSVLRTSTRSNFSAAFVSGLLLQATELASEHLDSIENTLKKLAKYEDVPIIGAFVDLLRLAPLIPVHVRIEILKDQAFLKSVSQVIMSLTQELAFMASPMSGLHSFLIDEETEIEALMNLLKLQLVVLEESDNGTHHISRYGNGARRTQAVPRTLFHQPGHLAMYSHRNTSLEGSHHRFDNLIPRTVPGNMESDDFYSFGNI